jgi:quercetin dioxygenase-like cupin family protein
MYYAQFFANKSQEEIKKMLEADGLSPTIVNDQPNHFYEPHKHESTNYLACIKGSMLLTVGNEEFNFIPGDKVIIPKKTIHFGKVSQDGCTYWFSEK